MKQEYYVLTSVVGFSMETPAIFSKLKDAQTQMKKEYEERMKSLEDDNKDIDYCQFSETYATIESDDFFAWNIELCQVDKLLEK